MAVNPKSIKNLRPPFKKGREWNGNAKGKPKGAISFRSRLREIYKEEPEKMEKILNALHRQAARGQLGHIQTVIDSVDGPAKQKIDISLFSDAFSDKSKEELDDILSRNLPGHETE